jgi:hypothetical protein
MRVPPKGNHNAVLIEISDTVEWVDGDLAHTSHSCGICTSARPGTKGQEGFCPTLNSPRNLEIKKTWTEQGD